MSCFFGCFRVKASHSHLAGPRKEAAVSRSRNALSSLFLDDDGSAQQNGQSRKKQNHDQPDVKMHKNEDNVLKASEVLTETPTEFANPLQKSEEESIPCREAKLISSLGVEKLNLEKQHEDTRTQVKACGGHSLNGSGSLVVDSPSSCITDGHTIRRSSFSSTQNSNIRDEISHKDIHDAKTHSETSIETSPECGKGKDEEKKGTKYEKRATSEESLSAFLKPPSSVKDWAGKDFAGEDVLHRRIPSDRPILGMVAAHWNNEEGPQVPPSNKWWDGNGIPNSTNKYKEDQKVNWHATPFEERLEKALSEESLISQTKHIDAASKGLLLEEDGEPDTAMSRLNFSPRLKSATLLS